ncbi:MAG TPA: DUF423 domain-containing protein [Flavisolibacter sp.]|jgi:uncharacterized membrane protein YgdD (TMEM256/DUF423 family)|nr:DUF423 domain-containing protein [Flavisolibacter sp.]
MQKIYLIIGTILAGLAVALGAFGAHGLKKIVSAENVATYQTGVQYQMYHALALILVGILSERIANHYLSYAGVLFVAGIVLFSGSLYLIVSLYAMNKTVPTAVGILTPIGGLFFILGWISLLISLLKK